MNMFIKGMASAAAVMIFAPTVALAADGKVTFNGEIITIPVLSSAVIKIKLSHYPLFRCLYCLPRIKLRGQHLSLLVLKIVQVLQMFRSILNRMNMSQRRGD